jgi:hypothetical protein
MGLHYEGFTGYDVASYNQCVSISILTFRAGIYLVPTLNDEYLGAWFRLFYICSGQ